MICMSMKNKDDFLVQVKVYDPHSHEKTDERMFHKPEKLLANFRDKYGWKPTWKDFLKLNFKELDELSGLSELSKMSLEDVINNLNKTVDEVSKDGKRKD